ncbi:MAG TPA: phosphatidate cytidylyltransferase [Candidatus Polarisedimenticolaceae bacterium]|nr:phosphatidate cytidylyltransferase [Candidatus Polarisedimenticolaceae bacterium]
MTRVLTAALLLPILWLTIKLAPPALFLGVAFVAAGLATWECYTLLDGLGLRPFKLLGVLAGGAVVLSFFAADGAAPALPLVAATIVASTLALVRRPGPREMLDTALGTLFPLLFVALTLGYVVGLRRMPNEDGQDLLLLLFLCAICADTAAYYVGSAFGRHRLAPHVSPRKSWEGVAAGGAGSVLGALLAHVWFYQRLPLGHALALGVLLAASGILGDLAESVIKRAAGAKDSSGLLPGHGGLLDRVDSLLFSAPLLYYYYNVLLRP